MVETSPVRPVEAGDLAALTGTLTRAFADDPLVSWAYPKVDRRAIRSPGFFAWSLRRLLGQDVSWTTTTRAGAALWALPGRWRETPREAASLVLSTGPGLGLRAPLVGYGLSQVERLHPTHPHLYLAVLGVDPHHQGLGLGSALLQPGLALCDEERLPAYLETATERNIDFYGRHGFVVTRECRLTRGPRIWSMWREPR
jgi:GNAT superfamily N-acetyltransferase